MTKSANLMARIAGVTAVVALLSCASRTVGAPPEPDPHADVFVVWSPSGLFDDEVSAFIGSYRINVRFPEDRLEVVLDFMCDADWTCTDWLRNNSAASVTRSDHAHRSWSAVAVGVDDSSSLISPRPYYLIDNPAMRELWRKPPSQVARDDELEHRPHVPVPTTVPRLVLEHLKAIESQGWGARTDIANDRVLMSWAREVCLHFKDAMSGSQAD